VPFDVQLFASKLRRYREQFEASHTEVAAATGIAESRLVQLEDVQATPTGDEVLILADYFKCDYKFFVSNEQLAPFEQTETLFRIYGDEISKADRWAVQELLFLCECEADLEQALGRPKVEPFAFEKRGTFFKGHGQEAAAALRRHLGYTSTAVGTDVYRDFRRLGFHIFRRKLENSNISGLCIKHPAVGYCLLINYSEDPYRQRFTAAHEAAHAILDNEQDVVVSFARWDKRDLSEVRANAFASHYLLPPTSLKVISESTAWDETKAVYWAGRLNVSTEALSYALQDAGIVTPATARELRDARVPTELKVDPELPKNLPIGLRRRREALLQRGLSRYYVDLCLEAFDAHYISTGRLAETLLVSEQALGGLLALFDWRPAYGY
jgi:Zn-dependent peptidase ImmA (M78 family)